MTLTPTTLREIEQRCEKATPGPWVEDDGHIHSEPLCELAQEYVLVKVEGRTVAYERPETEVALCSQDLLNFDADAEFISSARTDVPLLIGEVRRLREALGEFEAWADGYLNRTTGMGSGLHQEKWPMLGPAAASAMHAIARHALGEPGTKP